MDREEAASSSRYRANGGATVILPGVAADFLAVASRTKAGWKALHMPQKPVRTKGKFVTTAAVQLAVTLKVPKVPADGDQIRASSAAASPGGGYIVAAAVRAQGVESHLVSALGTGPNSHAIRRNLAEAGIEAQESALVGDIGVAVTMVEDDGKTAVVVAPGVETEPSPAILQRVEITTEDVVHIAGADLISEAGARVLVDWVLSIPQETKVVLAATPAISLVQPDTLVQLLGRVDILTMNIRGAAILSNILADVPGVDGLASVLKKSAKVVRRKGKLGCVISSVDADIAEIPAYSAQVVDTSGVGDTHVGVMCAALLQGFPLVEACRRANAAASLALSHPTSFPLPTAQQVDLVVEGVSPSAVMAATAAAG